MRARFDGDGLVDDVAFDLGGRGEPHLQPAHPADHAAIDDDIISDNLAAWLAPLRRCGRVIPSCTQHKEITALAKSLGIPWPRNVLRHSFISYRIAIVKSADQVALEAGNSPAIIFRHYRELTTEETAKEWFGIGR